MLTHDASLIAGIWAQFQACIVPALGTEDDHTFWSTAIGQIIADAESLCKNSATQRSVFTEIGVCSHWLRPHQTRWTADGGFAWPSGYGGSAYSRNGLPEFDWSFIWQWNAGDHKWRSIEKPYEQHCLRFRIAVPTRTARHDQAAVHTIWKPGCPTTPKQKVGQLYGFRKQDQIWSLTAHLCTHENVYHYGQMTETDAD